MRGFGGRIRVLRLSSQTPSALFTTAHGSSSSSEPHRAQQADVRECVVDYVGCVDSDALQLHGHKADDGAC